MSGSECSNRNTPKITLKSGKSPLPVALVIKKNRSITIRGNDTAQFIENLKFSPQKLRSVIFKEDVIYESEAGDFLKVNPLEKVVVVNMFHRLANTSHTVARFYSTTTNELLREFTSDNIVKLIGQKNYDTVFSALCSVLNLESKVRGIFSLLTTKEDSIENLCKSEKIEPQKIYEDKCCQTDENCMDLLFKLKEVKKKRIRRNQVTPYVVTDEPKKKLRRVVVHPKQVLPVKMIQIVDSKGEYKESQSTTSIDPVAESDETVKQDTEIDQLLDIKSNIFNEDSIGSISSFSCFSNYSADNLLNNPNKLIENVEHHTNTDSKINTESGVEIMDTGSVNQDNWQMIKLLDGSVIKVAVKPEDDFHIATPEILKCLPYKDRVKLLWYQAYIDWKYCLEKDTDGYMPIHVAVINDDVNMLRRQCLVLRSRQHNVDVTADDLTPLQMALLQDTPNCGALVATLLRLGADPLLSDSELRSPVHLAAEAPYASLEAAITHCQKHARSILEDHEDLWKPEYASRSDEDLSKILLDHVCHMFDGQGYTPLMVASRLGLHRNVQLLLKTCPNSVNTQTPNAGDTALYIAVGAACMHALDRGNKSKVSDDFKTTINLLVAGGADPFLENLSGSSVNDLLSENNTTELNFLICNKIASMKLFDGKMPEDVKNCDAYMLENNAGDVSVKEVGDSKKGSRDKVKSGVKKISIKKRNAKNKGKEISVTNDDDINGDGQTVTDKDYKTEVKPIILENIELPSIVKPIIINDSNVKFIKPQDKLEKMSSSASSSTVTDIISSSSNLAIQSTSKFDIIESKSLKKTIQSGKKEIVILNYSHSSIVGSTKLNPNAVIVNSTETELKRKLTEEVLEAKKQKTVFNLTLDK